MARNKHPEETVNRILDVALALFFEKGYDDTSIQDIIDGLGGLTKGAVYHHFKSKEDILTAAIDRDNRGLYAELKRIRDDGRMNGAEKLQTLFAASIEGPQMDTWANVLLANLWASPMFRACTAEDLRVRVDYYIDIVKLLGGLTLDDDGLGSLLEGYRAQLHERFEALRKGRDDAYAPQ